MLRFANPKVVAAFAFSAIVSGFLVLVDWVFLDSLRLLDPARGSPYTGPQPSPPELYAAKALPWFAIITLVGGLGLYRLRRDLLALVCYVLPIAFGIIVASFAFGFIFAACSSAPL